MEVNASRMRGSSTPFACWVIALLSSAGLFPAIAAAPLPTVPAALAKVPGAEALLKSGDKQALPPFRAAGGLSIPKSLSNRGPTSLAKASHHSLSGGISAGLSNGAAKPPLPSSAPLLVAPPISAFGFLPQAPAPLAGKPFAVGPQAPSRLTTNRPLSTLAHSPMRQPRLASAAPGMPAPVAPPSIVLDTTLGQSEQPVITTNSSGVADYGVTSGMGKQVGENLFFSFSRFGLETNESVTFSGSGASIRNILARVTGGSVSLIDGLIQSDIAGANLFLLNPAGVIFGTNARLQIGGSFIVSTADYLKLADGAQFSVAGGATDANLSAADVAAFGFVNPTPASVSFIGSQMTAAPNAGLHVIAGGINLIGATLTAPSGALTVFGASSAGEVPFTLAAPGAAYGLATAASSGAISIGNQSTLSIDGAGGGLLTLYGGTLNIDNSTLSSNNTGLTTGGPINIHGQAVSIVDGAQVGSTANASGDGGPLQITAGSLTVDGDNGTRASTVFSRALAGTGDAGALTVNADQVTLTNGGFLSGTTYAAGRGADMLLNVNTLFSAYPTAVNGSPGVFSNSFSSGPAGTIDLNATGLVTLQSGGRIGASASSTGTGGTIFLSADALTIDGSALTGNLTGVIARTNTGAMGDAGDVSIHVAHTLKIANAGEIEGDTFGGGNAGKLAITAGDMSIDGSSSPTIFTGISSQAIAGAAGDAGEVTINVANGLTISGAGTIAAGTRSSGHGGNATITAGTLTIDGEATPDKFTGISVQSAGIGNAGNLAVNVSGKLSVLNSGEINGDAFAGGDGGQVTVTAGDLDINGIKTPEKFTGITVGSNAAATGHGGSLSVKVTHALTIEDAGEISADTYSAADSGSLSVTAGSLTIDGSGALDAFTGIFADSNGTGDIANHGGSSQKVSVSVAGKLIIRGTGEIDVSTETSGNAGDLFVEASSLLIDGGNFDNAAGIFADSDGNDAGRGGRVGNLTVRVKHDLTIVGGGEIDDSTSSTGDSGKLLVTAGTLMIDGTTAPSGASGIFAESDFGATGNAGDAVVSVRGAVIMKSNSEISADTFSSGKSGNLTVTARSLTIDGSGLPTFFTGITADSNSGATGNAGNLTLQISGPLLLVNSGQIDASTYSSGRAGDLTINAQSLRIDGTGDAAPLASATGIFAVSGMTGLGGDAGKLKVAVDGSLVLLGGGEIATSTFSSGHAGDLDVTAASIRIDGSATAALATALASRTPADIEAAQFIDSGIITVRSINAATGIFSQAEPGTSGDAGSVLASTSGNLTLAGGGKIAADTYSSGNSGSVKFFAGSLSIDGSAAPFDFTGIAAESHAGATGASGDVVVGVPGAIQLTGGGAISALSASMAPSGSVNLVGGSLDLEMKSVITSANSGVGQAGSVTASVSGPVSLNGSTISSMAAQGSAGSVQISASDLNLAQASTITVQAPAGNAGDITLSVGGLLALHQSQVSAQAGLNGGNINLTPGQLLLDGGHIDANASQGAGGLITLNLPADAVLGNASAFYVVSPDVFQSGDSSISASSDAGIPGALLAAAPQVNFTNALVGLPGSLLDASAQLREVCAMRVGSDFSSFLLRGSEGVTPGPDEPQQEIVRKAARHKK